MVNAGFNPPVTTSLTRKPCDYSYIGYRISIQAIKPYGSIIQSFSLAPSIKKCPKSTPSPSATKCAPLSQYDPNVEITIGAEGFEGYKVNVMGGYDETSTRGILKAVEINGKYTLSLDGKSLDDDDDDSKD